MTTLGQEGVKCCGSVTTVSLKVRELSAGYRVTPHRPPGLIVTAGASCCCRFVSLAHGSGSGSHSANRLDLFACRTEQEASEITEPTDGRLNGRWTPSTRPHLKRGGCSSIDFTWIQLKMIRENRVDVGCVVWGVLSRCVRWRSLAQDLLYLSHA